MTRRLSCVPLGLLMLAVILTGSTAPVAEAQAQYPQTCSSNWCIIDIPNTAPPTYVMNNQWNKKGAHGSQSVTVYGSSSWSTTWDWKRKQEWTVTTFPSAITGWHWGWHFAPTQPGFPVAVSSEKRVEARVAYDYVPHASCGVSRTCRYDVAFDLWFHGINNPGPNSAPLFELMVWLSYSRADLWIGYTPIARDIDVDGSGYRWNVFQTASTNAVFVPAANQPDVDDANLNLMQFIQKIVSLNLGISSSWYLSSVEFGIEVYQGRGTLNVTSYDVTVEP